VTATGSGADFMEILLDFGSEAFSQEERDKLLGWYQTEHGLEDLSLVSYMALLIDHLPGHYKRMRQHAQATMVERDGASLLLLFDVHAYTAIGFDKGVLYEIMSARHMGAPKQLVLDVLGHAYLSAGPRGMNAVSALSDSYLQTWVEQPDLPPLEWPEGWRPDPEAFRSGIDYSTPDLTAEEIQQISVRHQRMHGTVPGHVELFGRLHPRAYKLQRIRYEKSVGNIARPTRTTTHLAPGHPATAAAGHAPITAPSPRTGLPLPPRRANHRSRPTANNGPPPLPGTGHRRHRRPARRTGRLT
jgi:hypothetical protein